ncbi:MAG: hypothetical protein IKK64_08435 [Bacteroidales bacterium]|nr:hypothetical protein [Bacteroidales bacterium]
MNPKVEEFINKMKKEKEFEEQKKREELLISLGLIDESKSTKEIKYFDVWDGTKECKWHASKQKYCKEINSYVPIEVTDEEYNEILKYVTIENPIDNNTKSKTTKWSNVISAITLIVLIIGIVSGIIVSIAIDSFIPIVYVGIYFVIYIPFMIGFSKIVEAAEKYLEK